VKASEYEISKLAMRLLYRGLLIDVGGAAVLFFLGLFLADRGIRAVEPAQELRILGYALLAVAVVELLIVAVLKRRWLTPGNIRFSPAGSFPRFATQVMILYIILYVVALSPAVYGFLFFMLGGTQDMFVLMCCLTLIGYMLIRPRPEFIARLVEPFDFDQL